MLNETQLNIVKDYYERIETFCEGLVKKSQESNTKLKRTDLVLTAINMIEATYKQPKEKFEELVDRYYSPNFSKDLNTSFKNLGNFLRGDIEDLHPVIEPLINGKVAAKVTDPKEIKAIKKDVVTLITGYMQEYVKVERQKEQKRLDLASKDLVLTK